MFRNEVESPAVNGIPREEPSSNKSFFDWFRLVAGLLVAALGVWVVSTEYKTFDIRREWTSVAAIFMFAFTGLYPWLDGKENKKSTIVRFFYWALATPVLLATLVSHCQQLISAYHWLGPGLSIGAVLMLVVLGILFKD